MSIITMGCKVNRADSASIAAIARSIGHDIAEDDHKADLFIINTCTVTAKSDAETRQIIRRVHKGNPGAKVLLTGCLARVMKGLEEEFKPFCVVVDNLAPNAIFDALNEVAGASQRVITHNDEAALFPDFSGRTRPFVKVQDGCDACCTYCIVPAARGRSRSVPLDAAREMVRRHLEAGRKELVLTGIHLGAYGRDLGIDDGLSVLIETLAPEFESHAGSRVRLSSIEPLELTDRLLDAIAGHGFVCRHLHVPLQSGSDTVLERMKRPYTAAIFEDAVGRTAAKLQGAMIGADVICGFPGETVEDHRDTVRLVGESPIGYLHVFTFSPRPGTPAALMKDRVEAREVKRRVSELRSLGEQKRAAFTAALEGRPVEAVIEREKDGGVFTGLTDSYIRVPVTGRGLKTGAIAKITIGRDAWGRFTGTAVAVEGGTLDEGGMPDSGKADDLMERIGYEFRDRSILALALVHRSAVNERNLDRADSNERLEFLGDAVLSLAITHEIVRLLPDSMEGALSRVRASLVNEQVLADKAREIGLGPLLVLGRGEEASGGADKSSILADAFEAVIGAVYQDGGFEAACRVIAGMYRPMFEQVAVLQNGKDYKTKLQEIVQQEFHSTPAYYIIGESGPDHEKVFEAEVRVGGKALGAGKGRSKREAEQEAAREAEEVLRTLREPEDEGETTD